MSPPRLNRPVLILMLGSPGAGKSFFARQMADILGIGHISGDRIRYELFESPRYDAQENEIVLRIMDYMAETFLAAGISAIYDDLSLVKYPDRLARRQLAHKLRAPSLTVWVQTDENTAFARASTRDRRKSDEKFSRSIDRKVFDEIHTKLQKPQFREDYVVVSGKYVFSSQQAAFMRKLRDLNLLAGEGETASHKLQPPNIRPLSSPRRDTPGRHIRIR